MENTTTKIMIVDGSEVSRTIIARIFSKEMRDASITTCANAQEAMQALEQDHYTLITTALMLPDHDGLELAVEVRKNETHRYTPVIVVSGDADSRLLREGFNAGVTDYFDKSLGYQAFVEFIKGYVRRCSGLVGNILYVEDSQTAAMVTRHIMEKHGLKITHTTSAEEALCLLEETQQQGIGNSYDIVITDFYLQGQLTGGDLLHAVRSHLHLSHQEMPVLVVTVADNERRQSEVFHAGANDFVTKPIIEEILMARIRSLLLIKQQFKALKIQAAEIRRVATTDGLTGVRSKRYLLDHGEQMISDPNNQPAWAFLLDIDHFRQINDEKGYITGDHILASLGEVLNDCCSSNSVPIRYAGEEFAIILGRSDAAEATSRAKMLLRKVEQLMPMGIRVTLSIGMACTADHPDIDLNNLLALADKALAAAKAGGRNQICVYSTEGIEQSLFSEAETPALPITEGDLSTS